MGEVPASNVPTGDEAAAIAKLKSMAGLQTPVLDAVMMQEDEMIDSAGKRAENRQDVWSVGRRAHESEMEEATTMEDQLGFEARVLKQAQLPSNVPPSQAAHDEASLLCGVPPGNEENAARAAPLDATPTLR